MILNIFFIYIIGVVISYLIMIYMTGPYEKERRISVILMSFMFNWFLPLFLLLSYLYLFYNFVKNKFFKNK
jgi:hypothetical protein